MLGYASVFFFAKYKTQEAPCRASRGKPRADTGCPWTRHPPRVEVTSQLCEDRLSSGLLCPQVKRHLLQRHIVPTTKI